MRRLILLLSVGWLPPYVPPSGACLCLGSRVLSQPLNAVEGSTTPGLRLCRCTLVPLLRAWVNPRSLLGVRCDGPLSGHGPGHDSGVFAACHEAPVTLTAPHVGFPPDGLEALGVCCEAQGSMAADFRGIAKGPGAFAEDASGMDVARVGHRPLAALHSSGVFGGTRPKHCISALGGSHRVRVPMAATRGTATGHGTPHKACRASPTGDKRQAYPGSWRACASRWRRAVCS